MIVATAWMRLPDGSEHRRQHRFSAWAEARAWRDRWIRRAHARRAFSFVELRPNTGG